MLLKLVGCRCQPAANDPRLSVLIRGLLKSFPAPRSGAYSHHQPLTACSKARRSASGGTRFFGDGKACVTRAGMISFGAAGSSGGQCPGDVHGSTTALSAFLFPELEAARTEDWEDVLITKTISAPIDRRTMG